HQRSPARHNRQHKERRNDETHLENRFQQELEIRGNSSPRHIAVNESDLSGDVQRKRNEEHQEGVDERRQQLWSSRLEEIIEVLSYPFHDGNQSDTSLPGQTASPCPVVGR